jgi:hypothetical protein
MSTVTISDLANAGDAIDYLVGRGIRASEAVEFVARVSNLHKKPKAPKLPKLPSAARKVPHTWPEGFVLDEPLKQFARNRGFNDLAIQRMWERFRDRNQARGQTYVDWNAAWRTWVNNQVEFQARDGRAASGAQDGNFL